MDCRTRNVRRAAFLLTLLSTAASSYADGVIRDGLGAISIGRGGANIAHADNGQMILDNPAAMVNMQDDGLFEFSVDLLLTDLRYQDPQNDVDGDVRPYPMPQVALVRRSDDELLAYGIGVYAPAGFGAEYNVVHPDFGPQRQKSFGALLKVLPAASVSLTDSLSVGAACGLAVSHVELEGPFHLQSMPAPGAPALLDLQSTGAGFAWNVGLQYELSECTMLGLAYTGETRLQLDGNARATVPVLGQDSFDAEVSIAWPRSLGAGIVHSPCGCRRYSLDVIWYDWSSAFDEVNMTLRNPSTPGFIGLLGNTFQDSFPLRWRDSVSVRAGYEMFVTPCDTLRCGYIYHSQPIPESTLTSFIPAILEHAVSVGYGRKFGSASVDLAYQFSWGRPQSVGASSILGGDFDNSRNDSAAHWISLSFVQRF